MQDPPTAPIPGPPTTAPPAGTVQTPGAPAPVSYCGDAYGYTADQGVPAYPTGLPVIATSANGACQDSVGTFIYLDDADAASASAMLKTTVAPGLYQLP